VGKTSTATRAKLGVLSLAFAACAATGTGARQGTELPEPAGPLGTNPVATFVTDSAVDSIAVAGDVVYAAGSIGYLGPRTGAFAVFRRGSERPTPNVPPIFGGDAAEGFVQAIVSDSRGGWIVGGSFTTAGGRSCARFARITHDGRLDPRFCLSPNATVKSLAVHDRTVYLGGAFTRVSGAKRVRLAAVSLTSGRLLPWTMTVTGGPYYDRQEQIMPSVDALTIDGDTLFVGGLFDSVAGIPRVGLAALDTNAPRVKRWRADLGPRQSFNWVRVLAARSGRLYLAGLFYGVRNQPAKGIGAIDTANARPIRWAPKVDNVTAIAISPNRVYLAASRDGLRSTVVAVSPRDGTRLRAFLSVPVIGTVRNLALSGRRLLMAGGFSRVASSDRTHLAAVDTRTGRVLAWSPHANAAANVVAAAGGDVAAGGTLTSVGGVARHGLAAIDGRSGRLLSWAPQTDGAVNTVSTDGFRLYVGGDFTHISGAERSGLAAFDVATGRLLDWAPKVGPPEKFFLVQTVMTRDGRVYVAGEFAHVDGKPRERLAAVDGISGDVLDWNPRLRGTGLNGYATFTDLEALKGRVYAAGTFTLAGGRPHESLAEIEADSGKVTDWAPVQNGLYGVQTVAATPQALYLGGDFGRFAGGSRRGLAAVDIESHELSAWAPSLGKGWVNTGANDLVVIGSMLAVAGDFRSASGVPRAGVALFDRTTGALVQWAPPPKERAQYAPDAIAASNSLLAFDGYAGGNADSVSVYRFGP
jgi:beta-propeller uncharacterized protein DUF5122